MTKEERTEFEKWALEEGYKLTRANNGDPGYVFENTFQAWRGWQASAQAQRERDAARYDYADILAAQLRGVRQAIEIATGSSPAKAEKIFKELTDDLEHSLAAAIRGDKEQP